MSKAKSLIGKEYEHREVVRRAVGLVCGDDLKQMKGGQPGDLKDHAHKNHAPFQVILRLTARAIQAEDDVPKVWHQDLEDLQRFVSSEDAELENSPRFELGMQQWHVLRTNTGLLPECRWVLDIARYTNDTNQATRWKYVNDERAEVERIPEEKWKPARKGWNKRNSSIVVLLGGSELLPRTALAVSRSTHPNHPRGLRNIYNTARFNPLLTSFLAAMSPEAPNRFLVIKYAVSELLLFDFQYATDRETGQEYTWLKGGDIACEWYALHTIRRMYRFRFGCSLFPQQELKVPLDQVQRSRDLGWIYYKSEVRKAYKGL